jgi:arginine exporter protein ArgO
MKQTGLIRIIAGITLVLGAVGGMEQQPEASLILQSLIALAGLALIMWAARDINRQANHTINSMGDYR